jgi:hypothetical protein
MTEDLEPSPEDVDRWTRNLLQPANDKLSLADPIEQKMIAKVLGTKTQAEEFLRHERRKPEPGKSRIDIRRPFKSRPPILRFEYWESKGDAYSHAGWTIERYENGKLIHTHSGRDWEKRDALLLRLQAAGFTCMPVVVAGVEPRSVQGRARGKRKAPGARADIIARIGTLTTDDLEEADW